MIKTVLAAVGFLIAAHGLAQAEIKVGVTFSATGNGASLGIPVERGFSFLPSEIRGEKVIYIPLDDNSDPSAAVRNARKLVGEHKVDLLAGPSNSVTGLAVGNVAAELRVPLIVFSPIELSDEKTRWVITELYDMDTNVVPTTELMVSQGVKTIGFIGFSDVWGDMNLSALRRAAARQGLTIVAEERYARADTSVAGQALKLASLNPDAIFFGTSGTSGAIAHLALRDRGWSGKQFATIGVQNREFVRLTAGSANGLVITASPLTVVDQLPDSNPSKPIALRFRDAYKAKFGEVPNFFAGQGYDGALIVTAALERALNESKPGTQEFREAVRKQFHSLTGVVGTTASYTFREGSPYGADQHSVVLVSLTGNDWRLLQK